MNIAIIFGGKSAEHEVSLRSARSILDALDDQFNPILIGISKKGEWFLCDKIPNDQVTEGRSEVNLSPGKGLLNVDVAFPVLHGPNGEDGTIQGLFRMMDIPFVGPGVLGSSTAMDKEVSKILLKSKKIPVVDWISFKDEVSVEDVEEKFDYPVFVKPANLGSSVGVSKAKNREELMEATDKAFEYDEKIIVERAIDGKELECSVLGNLNPKASIIGEIRPDDFYSYEEKYSDNSNTELLVPADISKELQKRLQKLAVRAFKANMCEGMARVDFLVENQKIYVNELNTIPGFTNISMYPKLWEESGLDFSDLVTELIRLAVDRHDRRKKLKTTY